MRANVAFNLIDAYKCKNTEVIIIDQCPLLNNNKSSSIRRVAPKGENICTTGDEEERNMHITYIDVISRQGEIG